MTAQNRRAQGAIIEQRVARWLETLGYRLVARNKRWAQGELDLVAYEGDALVFIEVRHRALGRHGRAEESVGHKKRRQLIALAARYCAEQPIGARYIRFDVVASNGDELTLFRDAFRTGCWAR